VLSVCNAEGACAEEPRPDDSAAATQSAGDCKKAVCKGGAVVSQNDDGDFTDDGNDCTDDGCDMGTAVHPARALDAPCGAGGALFCDGSGKCVGCNAPAQCPGMDDECQSRSCEAGACGTSFAPAGKASMSQTMGDCKKMQCDGQGALEAVADGNDPEDDGNPCTDDGCAAGSPVHTPTAIQTACGVGLKCDGAGKCVGCVDVSDCQVPGNACLVATCVAGMCGTANKVDGTACNDGNACSQTDTCQAGACTGNNPVVCAASNQCHTAGVCDPATGVCSNPSKADGTACNDGNACSQTDTCQAGACVGANPVVCAAPDQCHTAGACNPATGVCSNPSKADGTACNDGNSCTQSDTCQSGTCTGQNPIACGAPDQCHGPGACNPVNGVCSFPNKADGTACNDGNGCTQTDTCQAGTCTGANPVVCAAPDQCHTAGACNPATGVCGSPNKANGTACDDGIACTQTDTCQAGACVGANPVICAALDQCHTAGVCNAATGMCSNPNKANGTACNDGNGCTQTDTCQAGTCTGQNPVVCAAPDQCHNAGACAPATGMCSNPSKADGTACTIGGQPGTCGGGACAICGNGVVEGNEQCDDGNITPCDGCSPKCQLDTAITYATAAGLNASIVDDAYNGTQASMTCVNITVNNAGDNVVDYVCPTLGMTHTWIGDLTIKLVSPAGTVVTLMSMPGVAEAADNGASVTGDSSNLLATFPITWKDGGPKSAELMGNTLANAGVVCKDDAACVYDPNNGAAAAGKLNAFIGQVGPGTWKLCVGDSGIGDLGAIDQVKLVIGQ
jgi:cysteine-rich repeat protein